MTHPASSDPDVRARLVDERGQAAAHVADLEATRAGVVAASRDSNADDEHDPEGSTIAFEREQATALLAAARGRLSDLDAALARLDLGAYGRCERCGTPIGDERLAARPGTTLCIGCARSS